MSRGPGSRSGRLSGAAALTFALACGGVAGGTAPASAAPLPMDQCTPTTGVVLAVDFGKWGGPLLRSCGSTPTTGYALLNQGGWKTTGTSHDGPAFICRIGYSGFQGGKQFPTPDQEKCVLTPPATAYWSYWHADPGQSTWSYSQLGAMLYQPKPGSVDLWIFGGTNIEGTEGRPTVSPDSLRAHDTTPGGSGTGAQQPQPPQPPAGGGSTGATGTTGGSGSGAGAASGGGTGRAPAPAKPQPGGARPPAPATTPGTAATPEDGITPPGAPEPAPVPATVVPVEPSAAPPTDTPSEQPGPQTAAAAPTPGPAVPGRVMDAAPVADAPHDSGSMLPAVVGAVLVVALGVATVVTARRRRRAE
ncbi:prenyltransferase/squalene oxidase repeat-containing protein [Kitasatospora sp. Ki12]